MTNAEKIRAMTDEELGAFLTWATGVGMEWFEARACRQCQADHDGNCPTGESDSCLAPHGWEVLDWLKAPAAE